MADIIRNEVIDAVLTRQTIREYKPLMLTDAQLDTLTAAAMMAPSGRNCQPCHVRFICNDAMLRQMQIDFKNIVGWDTPVHTRSDKNPVLSQCAGVRRNIRKARQSDGCRNHGREHMHRRKGTRTRYMYSRQRGRAV